jgi:AIPR protein
MMDSLSLVRALPEFLRTYVDFRQHIEELYEDLSNVEKGKKFATLVKDTLNSQERFLGLEANLNPKASHDEGVDIFWVDSESKGNVAFCQSKFKIKGKDDLDNILSKFKAFEDSDKGALGHKQLNLLTEGKSPIAQVNGSSKTRYLIATLWKLDTIRSLYEKSGRPSVSFYKQLTQEDRLEIIDGDVLYDCFLSSYQKEYAIPQEIRFRTSDKLINQMNVHVGIISAEDLIEIYKKSRNGIFFENVRDFLGIGNKDSALDINNEIYKTAHDEPSKMIERNNGITFKASSIEYEGEYVVLKNAGIINGCQTTLCIVKAQPEENCYVPVKIVTTTDEQNSSDVARTANTQNRIDKINLELSDFIRPQLIKASLAEIGVSLADDEASKTAPLVAAFISKQQVFKSDLRFLFIGLFSATPRNIFNSDYAAIRFEEIKQIYSSLDKKKNLNSLLARLIIHTNKTFDELRGRYPSESKDMNAKTPQNKVGKVFNRFYVDQKGYKPYLIVLAIYCLLNIDDEKKIRGLKVDELVESVENIIDTREQELEIALEKIFRSVALSVIQHFSAKDKDLDSKDLDNEISQYLSQYISRTPLSSYYMSYGLL